MGSKQSSLSDTGSAETSPDSGIAATFSNGAAPSSAASNYQSHNQSHSHHHQNYHNSKQLKKRKSLKKAAAAGKMQLVTSVNNSTPSLRDKIDHLKMGVSFDTSDSSSMPDAEELERRFLKGKDF